MKFDFGKIRQKITSINYTRCFFDFLDEKSRWIIFLFLVVVSISCGVIWYKYVYHPDWSAERKKAYIDTKEKGIILDKNKFDRVVSEQKKREEEYERKSDDLKDVFQLGERTVK